LVENAGVGAENEDQGGPAKMRGKGRLQRILAKGDIAVTAECGPPKGSDPNAIFNKAALLKGKVDAVNVTDNQTAVVRMSSFASCCLLISKGLEPILQITVRDRNRIALQSDILGASAVGIRNVLCLSGDHQGLGNQPQAMGVYDLDSIQLLQVVKGMRDEGIILGGEPLINRVDLFIGAVANPFADPFEFRVIRLAKKISAGANFIQTQCIYNLKRFEQWLCMARDRGLTDRASILAGVTPLKSSSMAHYMREKVSGIDIPDEFIKRMEGVPKRAQREEGVKICVETIERLKEMQGIKGFHIMAIEWEEIVGEIVERAGMLPRPSME
jgi:methylenetetrahydrofolate reductase (NADPH)